MIRVLLGIIDRVRGIRLVATDRPAAEAPGSALLYLDQRTRALRVRTATADEAVGGTGGGGGSGDVVGPSSSVDSEIALFDSTTGKLLKRATTTGILKGTAGVLSAATQGTDYYAPGGTDVAVADGGTGSSTASGARTNLGLGSIAVENVAASGDLGGSWPSPTVTQARGLRETSGPTTLTMGAVADGQVLKRSGSTIIGAYIALAMGLSQLHDITAGGSDVGTLTGTGGTVA